MTTHVGNQSEIELGLASRWERFLGRAVDGMIAGLPVGLAAVVVAFSRGSVGFGLMMLACAWAALYFFFADGFRGGQSIAKQWLGMRVVDAHTGEPCTLGQSFVRHLTQLVLGPIDWIFIFGDAHQRLGDKLAHTVVIDAD
jgi:uncharacterized RDD family membrane protein YckC